MRCRYLIVIFSFLIAGCAQGFPKRTWTKAELVEWYSKYASSNPRVQRFGYCGSDDKYHYFVTRPIDSYLLPRVPRSESVIADERPRASLGRANYFYLVDPARDFRKIEESELPK